MKVRTIVGRLILLAALAFVAATPATAQRRQSHRPRATPSNARGQQRSVASPFRALDRLSAPFVRRQFERRGYVCPRGLSSAVWHGLTCARRVY